MWTAENTYQMIKQILFNCEADWTVLIRKLQFISGGGGGGAPPAHPLHPPPRSAPGTCSSESVPLQLSQKYKPSQHLYSNIINVSGHWNF